MTKRRFSNPIIARLDAAKIIGLRAGAGGHRFIGVWVVVVRERAFVRPWNDKPTGWYRAFLDNPRGMLQLGDREIRIRARPTRGERLWDEVDAAYAAKYPTPGSRGYVRGFSLPRRRRTTTELVPR
jgi:hypothetical protein